MSEVNSNWIHYLDSAPSSDTTAAIIGMTTMADEGQFRRTKSLPVKEGGVSAIYMGAGWQNQRGPWAPGPPLPPKGPPRPTQKKFLTALVLAACITLTATASLLYIIRTGRGGSSRAEPITREWNGEVVISGEFKITNEPFRPSLGNFSSAEFIQLSAKIGQHLNKLYSRSGLRAGFRGATVVELGPGLTVRCRLLMASSDPLTVSRAGLAFLAGLEHTQGHLTLGPYIVDIQSIGFQASSDEVSWSQWSDWGPCESDGSTSRRRVCLSLSGLKLKDISACEALPGLKRSLEAKPCGEKYPNDDSPRIIPTTAKPPPRTTSRSPFLIPTSRATIRTYTSTPFFPSSPVTPVMKMEPTQQIFSTSSKPIAKLQSPALTTTPSTTTSTTAEPLPHPLSHNASSLTEVRLCLDCDPGQVCVALQGEPLPSCKPAIDLNDPTGCGGHCVINTELCHRLTHSAYRCVDDSKCLEDEWQCGNQLCIPLIKRCDGHFNCYDHTDEVNCDCDLRTHFRCGKNLSCLPKSKRCDRIVDCWDATDESSCTNACVDSSQFTCNDSQCIPSKKFCDGYPDCRDHSDEPFGCGGLCKHHEWKCSNSRCITKREVCNGVDDCGDNSDEVSCGRRRPRPAS